MDEKLKGSISNAFLSCLNPKDQDDCERLLREFWDKVDIGLKFMRSADEIIEDWEKAQEKDESELIH